MQVISVIDGTIALQIYDKEVVCEAGTKITLQNCRYSIKNTSATSFALVYFQLHYSYSSDME